MSSIKNLPIPNDVVDDCINQYITLYNTTELPEDVQNAYTSSIDFVAADFIGWVNGLSEVCDYDTLKINLGVYTSNAKTTVMAMGGDYYDQGQRMIVDRLSAFITPYYEGNVAEYKVEVDGHLVGDKLDSLNIGELHP